jgi:hypothetical protein
LKSKERIIKLIRLAIASKHNKWGIAGQSIPAGREGYGYAQTERVYVN